MNYSETLTYLFDKLPMFTRIGSAAYKADLGNTIQLCNALSHPERNFKSIHIAGTNGKGSCSHMLASIFQTAGYKTGLYTSPHLIDFKERIKIDGVEIDEKWLVEFVEKLKPLIKKIQPSFFEVTVSMAFDYFAEMKVDIAIIETGLGGLLDSTNVIIPELSLITNISYDHTNLLGNTLEEIAIQKAGIIKENIPVVIGETQLEVESVFRMTAETHQSTILFADKQYEVKESFQNSEYAQLNVKNKMMNDSIDLQLDLTGNYQQKNCLSVLTAIDVLRNKGWKISSQHIQDGLKEVKKNTGLKGRFDTLQQNPTVIVDVAHNEAGLNEVLRQVHQLQYNALHIVTGFVKDKEIEKALNIFPKKATYYFTQADIPRALPFVELREKAIANGLSGAGYPTVTQAMQAALAGADKNDLILVTGSFFILADVYAMIGKDISS